MEFPRRSKRGFAPLEIRLEKLISVAFNTYSTKWTVYLTDKLYILLDNYLIIIQYFAFRRVLFWAPQQKNRNKIKNLQNILKRFLEIAYFFSTLISQQFPTPLHPRSSTHVQRFGDDI